MVQTVTDGALGIAIGQELTLAKERPVGVSANDLGWNLNSGLSSPEASLNPIKCQFSHL